MNRGGGDENSGNFLMSLIPSNCPKPDLFVIFDDDDETIDASNMTYDEIIHNPALITNNGLNIGCLYLSNTLEAPILSNINFRYDDDYNEYSISSTRIINDIATDSVLYNNKTYYQYHKELY